MFLSENTLDDLLRLVFQRILKNGREITPSRGKARELTGVMLELKNPRARISRTETRGRMFSCLGELLWYLSGTDALDFITYYIKKYEEESEDGRTVYGAYGPRLFRMRKTIDQLENVRKLLKANPQSRRAVVQIYDAVDIVKQRKAIPCTCVLQFLIRRNALHMITTMRSNDAFHGLVHDVFSFTMLQEILACILNLRLGKYKHVVGSLHIYEPQYELARTFLQEGWQSTVPMPAMPKSDPKPSLAALLKAEKQIRTTGSLNIDLELLDDYWADLVRLLLVFAAYRRRDKTVIDSIKRELSSQVYLTYIEQRRRLLGQEEQAQLNLN